MQAAAEPRIAGTTAEKPPGISLIVVLVLFLVAVSIVNPFREMPYDDDWAFSETAKHYLETGQYRLNEWLAPNMPFQTLWGALFCLPFGFSFGASADLDNRVSRPRPLGFSRWLLEHGLSRGTANLLTFCLASSPLVFKLTLTYLSDVPFLAQRSSASGCIHGLCAAAAGSIGRPLPRRRRPRSSCGSSASRSWAAWPSSGSMIASDSSDSGDISSGRHCRSSRRSGSCNRDGITPTGRSRCSCSGRRHSSGAAAS